MGGGGGVYLVGVGGLVGDEEVPFVDLENVNVLKTWEFQTWNMLPYVQFYI